MFTEKILKIKQYIVYKIVFNCTHVRAIFVFNVNKQYIKYKMGQKFKKGESLFWEN